MVWIVTPKISIFIYLVSLLILVMWSLAEVMSKRTRWFAFLKVTDIFAVLFLVELTSRWYFFIRGQEESILLSIALGLLGAVFSLVIIAAALFFLALLCIGLKKLYHFSLTGPVNKIKARTGRWIDSNWETADNITKKGLWKTFRDYMGL